MKDDDDNIVSGREISYVATYGQDDKIDKLKKIIKLLIEIFPEHFNQIDFYNIHIEVFGRMLLNRFSLNTDFKLSKKDISKILMSTEGVFVNDTMGNIKEDET